MGTSSTPASNDSRRHRVVVVGSSFAGLTAALEAKQRMKDRVEVTVIDHRDYFTFVPSLIWVPFGKRRRRGRHVPARSGVRADAASASSNADRRALRPRPRGSSYRSTARFAFDRVVIATGPATGVREDSRARTEQGLHPVRLHSRSRA